MHFPCGAGSTRCRTIGSGRTLEEHGQEWQQEACICREPQSIFATLYGRASAVCGFLVAILIALSFRRLRPPWAKSMQRCLCKPLPWNSTCVECLAARDSLKSTLFRFGRPPSLWTHLSPLALAGRKLWRSSGSSRHEQLPTACLQPQLLLPHQGWNNNENDHDDHHDHHHNHHATSRKQHDFCFCNGSDVKGREHRLPQRHK